jgi:NitT/TauT family transport system substrate-binding protein
VLGAAALFVAACGNGADGTAAPGAGGDGGVETTAITVGVQPFAEVAPLYVAVEQGLFEEEGLTVTPQVAAGGGAGLVTGIVAGDLQFAYSNYVSVIQAASQGLPLRVVRENDRGGVQGVFALPDSGISTPGDLVGKRVAINGLGNIMELTTRAALRANDVDPDAVSFVELPPPDMPAALSAGNVDAVWLAEPFVTLVTDTLQAVEALDVFAGPTEDLLVAGWVTSATFAQDNPNTVAAFKRAMDRAIDMVAQDPQLVVDILPTYTQLTPEVAAAINQPNFGVDDDPRRMSQVEELMRDFGIISVQVDTDELVLDVAD